MYCKSGGSLLYQFRPVCISGLRKAASLLLLLRPRSEAAERALRYSNASKKPTPSFPYALYLLRVGSKVKKFTDLFYEYLWNLSEYHCQKYCSFNIKWHLLKSHTAFWYGIIGMIICRILMLSKAHLRLKCFQETIYFGSKGNFHVTSRL